MQFLALKHPELKKLSILYSLKLYCLLRAILINIHRQFLKARLKLVSERSALKVKQKNLDQGNLQL
jgi:hypothetical protein